MSLLEWIEYLDSVFPYNRFKRESRGNCLGDIVAKFSEGRSGAFFFYTKDGRYLIKTLHREEAQLLLHILPSYTAYFKENVETYLARFYGLHSVKLYSNTIYFVVMRNVFPPHSEPQETFDLKGSWVARHTNNHSDLGRLMKDEDLHKQLLLERTVSSRIHGQLRRDTDFLRGHGIMDYSLLLGIYYVAIDPLKMDSDTRRHHEEGDGAEDGQGDDEKYECLLGVNAPNSASAADLESGGPRDYFRERAGTYHSVKMEVGDDDTAIMAQMIEGPGIYYLGIIDILQRWNAAKRIERVFKVHFRCMNKDGISCVEPRYYRQRFLRKMERIGIRPLRDDLKQPFHR